MYQYVHGNIISNDHQIRCNKLYINYKKTVGVYNMCFNTMIGIIDKSEVARVRKVCEDIWVKDSSFKFKIVMPGSIELRAKFASILILKSETKDMANKRGGWFIHKMKDANISDYFWVKACKNMK